MSSVIPFVNIINAAEIIKSAGIIACKSESVYGLSCDPFNKKAVAKLFSIKQRSLNKGFILILSTWSDLEKIINPEDIYSDFFKRNLNKDDFIDYFISDFIDNSGRAVSYVLKLGDSDEAEILKGISNSSDIAVRISQHKILSSLSAAAGGFIISTSANISGHKPCESEQQLQSVFGEEQIDAIVKEDLEDLEDLSNNNHNHKLRSSQSIIIDWKTGKILRK